ncbi:MAG: dipeptide ABC transporter ATP-binding protein, partial [Micrococcales bacterium]|nr:dipeptide ABC transporter ATP-binding protein [Micrococcales bacterium]
MSEEPLLDVHDLHVRFDDGAHAVRGVDLRMAPGQVLGLVGESGAGKSAFVCAVVGLAPRGASVTGSVRLDGTELVGLDDPAFSALRGPGVAMVFQDPLAVLNPLRRVGALVAEPLRLHDRTLTTHAVTTRVAELFALVGLPAGTQQAFAHELSGGMRQRVGIAVAIACSPRLLVADEPTSSLDVTVQTQVLDVLDTARQVADAGLLLVSHDLGVVAGWADHVAVMYAGRVVEHASTPDLFTAPQMPYTTGLLRAVPDPRAPRRLVPVPGDPPSAHHEAPGCAFAPRCPAATPQCTTSVPPLVHWCAPTAGSAARCGTCGGGVAGCDGVGVAPVAPVPPTAQPADAAVPPLAQCVPLTEQPDSPAAAPDATCGTRCDVETSHLVPQVASGAAHLVACWRAGDLDDDMLAAPEVPVSERPAPGAPVLEINDLRVTYRLDSGVRRRGRRGEVVAVDSVSLVVRRGETVALVGESGAGKTSTVERVFDGVPGPGTISVLGHDLATVGRSQRRRLRRTVALVAQDAGDALDPRMTIGASVGEPLALEHLALRTARPGTCRADRRLRVTAALAMVGLPAHLADAYPHQLSGGQRRRATIARALVTDPGLVVLDEPVAGLDVSVAAGVLELLADLRDTQGLTTLVVTHDLAVVRQLADRVVVMAVGRAVEEGPTHALFAAPAHPYTQAL